MGDKTKLYVKNEIMVSPKDRITKAEKEIGREEKDDGVKQWREKEERGERSQRIYVFV